jgi:hypothetical protein
MATVPSPAAKIPMTQKEVSERIFEHRRVPGLRRADPFSGLAIKKMIFKIAVILQEAMNTRSSVGG